MFWVYLGVALWIGLSVPFGLLAGAIIRSRPRSRVIDLTDRDATPVTPLTMRTAPLPAPQRSSAEHSQLTG